MKRIALCFLGLALLLVAPVVTEAQNRQANTTDLGVELEAYSQVLPRRAPLWRECGHGKTIHNATRLRLNKKLHTPCRFRGCDCRDYKPKKT
jgi:hypothetical protein